MNIQVKAQKPILSYSDIRHSMRFLSFFGYYAAPLYQFTAQEFMRDYLPTLLLSQGMVYQADAVIEAAQKNLLDYTGLEPWFERKTVLMNIAKEVGAYTPMLEFEADNVTTYWELEDQMMHHAEISHKMVVQAIDLRVSDIMMLHQICHHIANKPNDETIWAAIRVFEEIRDIEADLREYHDDVASGDFNVYRMFVRLYGADAVQHIDAQLHKRQAIYQNMVANLPDDQRLAFEELNRLYYQGRPARPIPEPIFEFSKLPLAT